MNSLKVIVLLGSLGLASACTETTASGPAAPTSSFCAGDLIFEENFNTLDLNRWKHEITMGGGGNGEFQWYVSHQTNSYATNGTLNIKPTYTSDIFGEHFLSSARVIIPPYECTSDSWNGCDRQGSPEYIINPIRSGKVSTWDSFKFRYGALEIRAKLPAGDWLWPALWMMPDKSVYGGWPTSGEIDLMESRGNRELYNRDGVNIGTGQVGSTLHFGPRWDINGYSTSHGTMNKEPKFDEDYHTYRVEWKSTGFQFFYDGELMLTIPVGDGFWARGGFESSGLPNPWSGASPMAPFDQEFYIIINLAVGGDNGYFPDGVDNLNGPKPWTNNNGRARTDFWNARSIWEPTWNFNNEDRHFKIDYVRVWAV